VSPALEPLVDGHGRTIGDVRISVTDRCNFRCQYCMPAEGLPWLERAAVLSYEEIERVVALLGAMGVHDVRLTGGEPLVRRSCGGSSPASARCPTSTTCR
jgi:cyclic pyranopterin phosphate synthase